MIQRMLSNTIRTQPDQHVKKTGIKAPNRQKQDFAKVLENKLGKNEENEIKFSAHASRRLNQRNINLSSTDQTRLTEAVKQVSAKGAQESLIIMDDVSYVVNVPNKTVITAMDGESSKNNVFTNIDSTMIVK